MVHYKKQGTKKRILSCSFMGLCWSLINAKTVATVSHEIEIPLQRLVLYFCYYPGNEHHDFFMTRYFSELRNRANIDCHAEFRMY